MKKGTQQVIDSSFVTRLGPIHQACLNPVRFLRFFRRYPIKFEFLSFCNGKILYGAPKQQLKILRKWTKIQD